jgi:hypothetical protein
VQHGPERKLFAGRMGDWFGFVDWHLHSAAYCTTVIEHLVSYGTHRTTDRSEGNQMRIESEAQRTVARRKAPRQLRSAAAVIAQYIQDLSRPGGPGPLRPA